MSDQLKPRSDQGQRLSLPQEQPASPLMDDAEAQMRKALGLYGEGSRPRPDGERQESGQRFGGGFIQGLHRRRFVQDGEVPVTVVRRDVQDALGNAPAGPTSSRLQRVEAALAAETAARDRADRALHDAQAALQALQTKIGHNELAKNEALAAGKRDRDETVSLREQLAAANERSHDAEARADAAENELRSLRAELNEERRARKLAEKLLSEASEAPAFAESTPVRRSPIARQDELPLVPARRGRPPLVRAEPEIEGEPVKWWLLPAKTTAKRR